MQHDEVKDILKAYDLVSEHVDRSLETPWSDLRMLGLLESRKYCLTTDVQLNR